MYDFTEIDCTTVVNMDGFWSVQTAHELVSQVNPTLPPSLAVFLGWYTFLKFPIRLSPRKKILAHFSVSLRAFSFCFFFSFSFFGSTTSLCEHLPSGSKWITQFLSWRGHSDDVSLQTSRNISLNWIKLKSERNNTYSRFVCQTCRPHTVVVKSVRTLVKDVYHWMYIGCISWQPWVLQLSFFCVGMSGAQTTLSINICLG